MAAYAVLILSSVPAEGAVAAWKAVAEALIHMKR